MLSDTERLRRIAAFKSDMRARGLDEATIDGCLEQIAWVEKSAAEQKIAYKSASPPSSNAVYAQLQRDMETVDNVVFGLYEHELDDAALFVAAALKSYALGQRPAPAPGATFVDDFGRPLWLARPELLKGKP